MKDKKREGFVGRREGAEDMVMMLPPSGEGNEVCRKEVGVSFFVHVTGLSTDVNETHTDTIDEEPPAAAELPRMSRVASYSVD